MRKLRPELYSDTVDRPLNVLDRPMLEFQLETMTSRNEHQRFEIFCRKLCQRVVCPNLRPQSGPEGGGDGKTDADTFPVAEAIVDLSYIGSPGPGRDDWGFAFSAMKDWKRKVVKDVNGIAATGRKLERIYFVTSQPARAADRARIEAELEQAHGIPVKILDRAWIVEEVIDHERKDIAHDYLGVGQMVSDPMRMGPEDYSRRRRLEDIERGLADPSTKYHQFWTTQKMEYYLPTIAIRLVIQHLIFKNFEYSIPNFHLRLSYIFVKRPELGETLDEIASASLVRSPIGDRLRHATARQEHHPDILTRSKGPAAERCRVASSPSSRACPVGRHHAGAACS